MASRRAAWVASVGAALAVGCTSAQVTKLVDPLEVFFSQEEPVRVGIMAMVRAASDERDE